MTTDPGRSLLEGLIEKWKARADAPSLECPDCEGVLRCCIDELMTTLAVLPVSQPVSDTAPIDVTPLFRFSNPDDELLPVTRCACGATFKQWEHTLSVYADDPRECESCHRRFYFTNQIRIVEAVSDTAEPKEKA